MKMKGGVKVIVAKTRMRKLPKSCKDCNLSFQNWVGERTCAVKKKDCQIEHTQNGQWKYGKPIWCPLMEMEATNDK